MTSNAVCVMPIPQDAPSAPFAHPKLGEASSGWTYGDEHGGVLGYAVRFDRPAANNPRNKDVLPLTLWRRVDGRLSWEWKAWPGLRPLYGLNRLAARLGARVLVVEGEKAADAAGKLFPDFVVITSPGGANAARHADWAPLKGRDVVIWPDADKPGHGYAEAVAELVSQSGAAAVKVVLVPEDFPDGWDLADEVPPCTNPDGLRTMLDSAQAPAMPEGPLPLRRTPSDPMAFPIANMGFLRSAVEAIHDKTQAPIAICGQSVLAAASFAVQVHVDIALPTGEQKPTSCFFVTIAESGERKSASDSLAMKAVEQYQLELVLEYRDELQAHKNRHAVWQKQHESVLKSLEKAGNDMTKRAAAEADLHALGPEPRAPFIPQVICKEPTTQGLFKLLKNNVGFAGLMSAEGGAFIGGFGMSEDNKVNTAANLSDLWDGTPIDRTRGGDELTVLRGRRAALHLMVQPIVAEPLLSDAVLIGQGLMSRIFFAAPPSAAGSRLWREARPESDTALRLFGDRILQLLRSDRAHALGDDAELTPRALPLSSEAREIWIDFNNKTELQRGPNGRLAPIKGFANKLPEHAARLAAVLTAMENLNATEISADRMMDGIALAEFYTSEALRLFEAGMTNPDLVLAEKVLAFIKERGELVSLRCVYTHGPNAARDKATAARMMKLLEDHHWVERADGVEIDRRKVRQAWRLAAQPL
jgi:hypothetical protein